MLDLEGNLINRLQRTFDCSWEIMLINWSGMALLLCFQGVFVSRGVFASALLTAAVTGFALGPVVVFRSLLSLLAIAWCRTLACAFVVRRVFFVAVAVVIVAVTPVPAWPLVAVVVWTVAFRLRYRLAASRAHAVSGKDSLPCSWSGWQVDRLCSTWWDWPAVLHLGCG